MERTLKNNSMSPEQLLTVLERPKGAEQFLNGTKMKLMGTSLSPDDKIKLLKNYLFKYWNSQQDLIKAVSTFHKAFLDGANKNFSTFNYLTAGARESSSSNNNNTTTPSGN